MTSARYSTSRLSYHDSALHPSNFDDNSYGTATSMRDLTIPNRSISRSKSPNLDAELKDVRKSGKDYHVTVNLNTLLSADNSNHNNNSNFRNNFESSRHQQNINRRSFVQETTGVIPRNINDNHNNFRSNLESSSTLIGGARKTVVNLDGEDDINVDLIRQQQQQMQLQQQQLKQQQQQQRTTLLSTSKQQLLTTSPGGNRSLLISSSIPPQTALAPNDYTVKSITSSEVSKQNFFSQKPVNDTVEFNLQLNGHLMQRAPQNVTPPTEWTVYGGVPVYQAPIEEPIQSKRNQREIVDDDDDEDDDEEDIPLQEEDPKAAYKALYDMSKSNWWLNLEYGSAPQVTTEGKKQKVLPRETATESIDVVTEQVRLKLDNYVARANVDVRCERITPIDLRQKLYAVTAVVVTKNIEFDMNSSDETLGLYENAIAMEKRSGGKLSNEDIKRLFVKMVEINKSISNGVQQNVRYDSYLSKTPVEYYNENEIIPKKSVRDNYGIKSMSKISNGGSYGEKSFQSYNNNADSRSPSKKSSMKISYSHSRPKQSSSSHMQGYYFQ